MMIKLVSHKSFSLRLKLRFLGLPLLRSPGLELKCVQFGDLRLQYVVNLALAVEELDGREGLADHDEQEGLAAAATLVLELKVRHFKVRSDLRFDSLRDALLSCLCHFSSFFFDQF